MASCEQTNVVWFKRDLRIADHAPLVEAVSRGPVIPLLVIEPELWKSKPELPQKTCMACNRLFTWRKKWVRDWKGVRYCSERCRRGKGQVWKGVS